MAVRAALLDHHAHDAAAVPVEKLRRTQPAGEQDCPRRHLRQRHGVAVQRLQQPVREVLDVGEPLAQIGIGNVAHSLAQLARNALHGSLGRQPAADRLRDPAQPAGIGGEQPRRVQHVARGSALRRALDQCIKPLAHGLGGPAQTQAFGVGVLGQQPARVRRDAPQHHRADREAGCEARALELARQGRTDPLLRAAGRPGGDEHLRQQHRNRREQFHLVFGIEPRRPVLHREHAHRPPRAPHRDREQRGIGLLPGLGPVREGGMILRVRQVERLAGGGDQTDDPLAHPQPRPPDRARPQAHGRHQLQDVARPHRVDRAHFRHQLGSDQPHQFAERRRPARHRLAQAGEQATGGTHAGRRGTGTKRGAAQAALMPQPGAPPAPPPPAPPARR